MHSWPWFLALGPVMSNNGGMSRGCTGGERETLCGCHHGSSALSLSCRQTDRKHHYAAWRSCLSRVVVTPSAWGDFNELPWDEHWSFNILRRAGASKHTHTSTVQNFEWAHIIHKPRKHMNYRKYATGSKSTTKYRAICFDCWVMNLNWESLHGGNCVKCWCILIKIALSNKINMAL